MPIPFEHNKPLAANRTVVPSVWRIRGVQHGVKNRKGCDVTENSINLLSEDLVAHIAQLNLNESYSNERQ